MRLRLVGLLALVIATAGCSAFVGGGEPTPTLTPAEVPDPPTPTETGTTVAPGVSTSEATDPVVLAQHHVAAAQGTSYVYREEYREIVGNERTADVQSAHRIVVENDTVYRRVIPSYDGWIDGDDHHLVGYGEYADGSTLYRSWHRGDAGRVYQFHRNPGERTSYARYAAGPIERYLDLTDPTITRMDVEGSTAAHFQVSGTNVSLPTARDVDDYRVRAVVREDGFVKRLDVEYDTSVDGRDLEIGYNFSYRSIGSASVTPPTWADEARTAYEERVGDERPKPTPTYTDVLEGGTEGPG